MTQYINKDAVMAIIKNHRSMIAGIPGHFNESSLCNEILIDIDTLEVKEVNSTDDFIEKVESFLNKKDDRDSYTIGYIKRHLKEIIKEVGL